MPLSEKQRALLVQEAKRRGVDEEQLIAEAEKLVAERAKEGSDESRTPREGAKAEDKGEPSKEAKAPEVPKPLYQYHLPFVTVNEVREIWLGLGKIDGGEEIAAKYAARQVAAASSPAPPSEGDVKP